MQQDLSGRDYELLSAYLDGALDEDERADLEARLETDAALRRELAALRQTVALVRSLPTLKAPRSFTLTAAQAEQIRPQNTATTFTAEPPDNILTLPTARPTGRVMPRHASRQPFWVGAAAAVVLGMICVATLLLTMSSVQMPTSSLQVGAMSTATELETREESQESQSAAEEAAGGAANTTDTTTESAEGDDGAGVGTNGRDDRPSGTGGAAVPAEPSTTQKLNETPVTAQAAFLGGESPTASPMGTLDVQRAVGQTEMLLTQPADTFAYDPTADGWLTLTAEDLTLRGRITTGMPPLASPIPGVLLAASPPPAPSVTLAGYTTTAALPTNEAPFEATLVDTFDLNLTDTFSQNAPSDVTDEATTDAESTDTDAASDVTPLTMMTTTVPAPNMQELTNPPTLDEAESDILGETMGMLAAPSDAPLSMLELLIRTLFQIILNLF